MLRLAPFLLLLIAQESKVDVAARSLASRITKDSASVDELFDASFLKQIPAAQIKELCTQFFAKHGGVVASNPFPRNTAMSGKFQFTFEKGATCTVSLAISDKDPHLITTCWFGPISRDYKTADDVIAELKKLPGTVNLVAARLDNDVQKIAGLNADTPLAVGSSFKLFILGALIADRKSWSDVVALKSEHMSLPSGDLHTWPADSPITIHTLAAKMISQSDNTATDHLLALAGRERVEKMMKEMGTALPTVPCLSTLEAFKLKTNEELRKKYLATDEKGRRELLAGAVRDYPREKIVGFTAPTAIDTIEWLASAGDLCRAMDWIRKAEHAASLKILAINSGIETPPGFAYIGYKGGSEPGVLNLTYLLGTTDGRWFALSAGWNDPQRAVDPAIFTGLVHSMIRILGRTR